MHSKAGPRARVLGAERIDPDASEAPTDIRAGSGTSRSRLLKDAQAARIRAIASAYARRDLAAGASGSRSNADRGHPWGELVDALFRPGSKQHRAAERLLSTSHADRRELADRVGLSVSAISNLINSLSAAGFDIERRIGAQRRVHFHVRGHDRVTDPCGDASRHGQEQRQPVPAGHHPRQHDGDQLGIRLSEHTGAHVRYLGQVEGLTTVEIDGHGALRGRLLGPVLPMSLLTGAAVLHRVALHRCMLDVEIGDGVHRVRLRLDLEDLRPEPRD